MNVITKYELIADDVFNDVISKCLRQFGYSVLTKLNWTCTLIFKRLLRTAARK